MTGTQWRKLKTNKELVRILLLSNYDSCMHLYLFSYF